MNVSSVVTHRARAQRVFEECRDFFAQLEITYKIDGEEYVELFAPETIIKWLSIIPYRKLAVVKFKIQREIVSETDRLTWALELRAVAQMGKLIGV